MNKFLFFVKKFIFVLLFFVIIGFLGAKVIYFDEIQKKADYELLKENKLEEFVENSFMFFLGLSENTNIDFEILSSLKNLAQVDLVDLLEYSADLQKDLDNYIAESRKVLLQSDLFISELKSKISYLEGEKNDCESKEYVSNQDLMKSLDFGDSNLLEKSLIEYEKYSSCAASLSSKISVYNQILVKFEFYYRILDQRVDYLEQNKYYVVKFFDVIKDDLASKLQEITWNLKYKSSYYLQF